MGLFTPASFVRLNNVSCVRETKIPEEQQPQQGIFVWDYAGLVINQFSLARESVGLGLLADDYFWWLSNQIVDHQTLMLTSGARACARRWGVSSRTSRCQLLLVVKLLTIKPLYHHDDEVHSDQ